MSRVSPPPFDSASLRAVKGHESGSRDITLGPVFLEFALLLLLGLIASQFRYIWESMAPGYLEAVARSEELRPYVYRALLPFLARIVSSLTGAGAGEALLGLFVFSSLGLYYSIRYLYTAFSPDDLRAKVVSFLACLGIDLLLFVAPHPYDVPTAAFFALSLGLMARGKLAPYFLLFPIATVNRETTFLLLLFFLISFFGRLPWRDYLSGGAYQMIVYLFVKLGIERIFADRPGTAFDWNLERNLRSALGSPYISLILLGLFIIICFFVFRGWEEKPLFLRRAFLVLFPAQVVLYFLLGGILELRVFVESAPVVFLLMGSPGLSTAEYSTK